MIKPTVGRVVWFHPDKPGSVARPKGVPLAAIVAFVHSDALVNLAVFDVNGSTFARSSVPLIQDGEEKPDGPYCEWMPYQKGQAAKTEAAEKQLAEKG